MWSLHVEASGLDFHLSLPYIAQKMDEANTEVP